MLRNVLALVRPSSTSLPLVSTSSAAVLNFHNSTPTGPSLAARLPQALLSLSCASMLSMRCLVVRYSAESGGSRSSAFAQAFRAPFQSPACPASRAWLARASNSEACASRPQDGQPRAPGANATPQFWQNRSTDSIVSADCGHHFNSTTVAPVPPSAG